MVCAAQAGLTLLSLLYLQAQTTAVHRWASARRAAATHCSSKARLREAANGMDVAPGNFCALAGA